VINVKLTEKQKRFADYYIETGNATESAKRAGYSENTATVMGYENLTKPYIKQYIEERLALKDNDRIASQEEILTYLTSVMRGEVTEEVPVQSKKGVVLVDAKAGVRDRTKAAELLGKRYVLWTDRKEIDGNIGVTIVDDLDDDED
jgi:phage terminase small subunit